MERVSDVAYPPAGWYEDPEDPSRQRFWSGTEWTDERRLPPTPPATSAGGFAVTALVLGIVGTLLAFVPLIGMLGFLLGASAVIFGILARTRSVTEATAMATAGIVLGAVAMVLAVATTGLLVVGIAYDYEIGDELPAVGETIEAVAAIRM